MTFSDQLPRGVRRLFRLPQSYERRMRDLDEEIAFHMETLIAGLRAGGMSEDDARAAAVRRFGNTYDLRAYCGAIAARREPWRRTRRWADELRRDVAFALRQVARAPLVTATSAIILALGIGANAAVFSIVYRTLLHPLPFADGNRMVTMFATSGGGKILITPTSALLDTWRQRVRSIEQQILFEDTPYVLGDTTRGERQQLNGAAVPPSVFSFLGVKPILGRAILPSDTLADAPPVVVLGEGVWRHSFGASPDVLGSRILLNGSSYTVVGVAPAKLVIPFVDASDAFTAFRHDGNGRLTGLAKLRRGVSIDDANREMKTLFPPSSELNPYDDPPRMAREIDEVGASRRQMILMLFGAVGILLLIACANVGNLLLARSWSRNREFAVRAVLGAGRWRIARQVFTESLILALAAGGLAMGAAFLVLAGIRAALPTGASEFQGVTIDGAAFVWTVVISILAGLAFGVAPAIAAGGSAAIESLKAGGRTSSGSSAMRRLRTTLVVAELALSVVLLTGAGLLVRTLVEMARVDVGFEARGLTSAYLYLNAPVLADVRARHAALGAAMENVRAIPGVRSAVYALSAPPTFGIAMGGFEVVGRETGAGDTLATLGGASVSPDFFKFAGIPIIKGRTFTPVVDVTDRFDANEVIINEKLARRLWPNGDALGAHVRRGQGPTSTVVGIVGDVRIPGEDGGRKLNKDLQVYSRQPLSPMGTRILVRSDLPASVLQPALTKAIHDASPAIRLGDPTTAVAEIEKHTGAQRFVLRLIGGFAILAVLLAMVGLHSVVSYAVNQRTREIGVRVALGAQATDVTALVLGQGLALAAGGVVVGVVGAMLATRSLGALLYGVRPGDPITLGAVGLLILAIAVLATYAPARRASRLDPVEALRAG